jgi:hypothetical protein
VALPGAYAPSSIALDDKAVVLEEDDNYIYLFNFWNVKYCE